MLKDNSAAVNKEVEPLFTINQKEKYDPFALTDIQYAYWVGSDNVYELGNTGCHSYFELSGCSIDSSRFEKAINDVIQQHDMLRAVINHDGTQRILKETPYLDIKVNNYNDKSIEDDAGFLESIRRDMSHQRFDYSQWPLFDVQVTKYSDCFILHYSFDLIILDAFSIRKLLYEIACRYKESDRKQASLSVSFRDWVEYWQQVMRSNDYQKSLDFWNKETETWSDIPQLPLKTQPGNISKSYFKRNETHLTEQNWTNIKNYARKCQLTMPNVLLSIFIDVIRKWSASESFLINMTIFNRLPVHEQINDVLGDFTSSLIFNANKKNDSFVNRTREIQKQLWKSLPHHRVSGVQVLRELAKRGDTIKYVPVVFTSMLGYEDTEQFTTIEDTLGKYQYGISQTPQVWLDYQVSERNGQLILTWDYLEEIFPGGMINDMFEAYEKILLQLAENSGNWETLLFDMQPKYQKRIVSEANSTESTVSNKCLHELFLNQVDKFSTNQAIIDGNLILDYRSLFNIISELANTLYNSGVRQNDNVAIIMKKGWEQVAAVLAINYIGAAYVPIDIHAPETRQHYLLENTRAKVVLIQPGANINTEIPVLTVSPQTNPENKVTLKPVYLPDSLAYIIFTSGSTGEPKGVAVSHRSAVNTILDINERFRINSSGKVLALSSLNFDLSVYDIYGMLASGGCMVIPDEASFRDPERWLALIKKHSITLWNSVPALMGMLVNYLVHKTEYLETLETVLLSGDWIPVDLPDNIKKYANNARVISLGGATEAAIWSIYYPIKQVDPALPSIPYGKPLTNQTFHVLDKELSDCPFWVTGDLYIGGVGLAKCYWADTVKTTEKFIVHPTNRQVLYNTGDLGRYLPDGNIEFIGRNDDQVKIQGFRVELGEIESTLLEHPEVNNAIVTANGEAGHKKLIAYIVAEANYNSIECQDASDLTGENSSHQSKVKKAASATSKNKKFKEEDITTFINTLETVSSKVIRNNFRELGLFKKRGEKHYLSNIIQQYNIKPHYEKLVRQWLNILIMDGYLEEDDEGFIISKEAFTPSDFKPEWKYLEESSLINNDFLEYLKLTFEHQIDLLQGKTNPLELFFPNGSWERALGLYESNPLSRYYNSILVSAVSSYISSIQGKSIIRILEVGAGTGGTTAEVLPKINNHNVHYTFTDLTTFFTHQAKQRFSSYDFVDYRLFNIDQDPQQQAFDLNDYDVIIASNVLHDAHNINQTLKNLSGMLKSNGMILIREATRNSRTQMVSVGFIEGFSGYQDEREIENLPLLSVSQWKTALNNAGLLNSSAYPEEEWSVEGVQENILISYKAPDSTKVSKDILYNHLQDKIPEYMVPEQYIILDKIPLTSQGKVDRKALPLPEQNSSIRHEATYAEPQTDLQSTVVSIWQEVLGVEKVGIDDNFFDVGGDSLYLTMTTAELERRLGLKVPMTELFRFPTIRSLTAYLTKNKFNNGSSIGSDRGLKRKRNIQRRIQKQNMEVEHDRE